jgi:hypothetical protein
LVSGEQNWMIVETYISHRARHQYGSDEQKVAILALAESTEGASVWLKATLWGMFVEQVRRKAIVIGEAQN